MQAQGRTPIAKDVVLVGGGHAHALFLRMYAMAPWPGVRVTLLSDSPLTTYSGMLPGLIAGHYTYEQAHIDLSRLALGAGARFIDAAATGLDLKQNLVYCGDDRPPLHFDRLSLNIGSILPLAASASACKVVPVKPVKGLLTALAQFEATGRGGTVAVIGGGIAGVEMILALAHRYTRARIKAGAAQNFRLLLLEKNASFLPQVNSRARSYLSRALKNAHVEVLLASPVLGFMAGQACCGDGRLVAADLFIATTGAAAPPWLKGAGLEVDELGFVAVNAYLQATRHPKVFAAGDICSLVEGPRPKAGVFAVRAAAPLFKNLHNSLTAKSFVRFRPQRHFLSLIGTGDGKAVACRGRWAAYGSGLGWLKRRIDGRFMRRLQLLPAGMLEAPHSTATKAVGPPEAASLLETQFMRCRGCAAKWQGDLLSSLFARLRLEGVVGGHSSAAAYLLGHEHDDAAVVAFPSGELLVQTIDYMPAPVDDPFLFGRLLVNHCLSDLWAMGAKPHSVQLLAVLPFSALGIAREDIYQLLQGVLMQLEQCGGGVLLGGHTAEGSDLAAGLTCNGSVVSGTSWRKGGAHSGDVIVLTKGLGVGVALAAHMRGLLPPSAYAAVINTMLMPQHELPGLMAPFEVHACTDITGFGLLGHLHEMAVAAGLTIALAVDALTALPGASEAWQQGLRSSADKGNQALWATMEGEAAKLSPRQRALLADPQTCGPLAFALPSSQAAAAVAMLHQQGFTAAAVIAAVVDQQASPIVVASV